MSAAGVTGTAGLSEGLLSRVRKLLAQAEDSGATAAEAEAFNVKAAELIARYGIDAALLASDGRSCDEIGHRVVVVDTPYARDKAHLLACVAGPLRCRTVHFAGRDAYRVRLYGFGANLRRVELLYTSLLVQATRDLVAVRPDGWYGHESTAAYRRSWLSGFAAAVHLRLTQAEARAATEQPVTAAGTFTGLVLRDRTDRVAQVVRDAHPGLRTMGHRNLSGSGRSEGYGAGSRANLGHTAVGATRALPRRPAAPR